MLFARFQAAPFDRACDEIARRSESAISFTDPRNVA